MVVHGAAVIEWLEGERFLIVRARADHPAFPDSISIIGITERDRVDNPPDDNAAAATDSRSCMHYFDSRGVFRALDVSIDDEAWRFWRDAPGFCNALPAPPPTLATPSSAARSCAWTTSTGTTTCRSLTGAGNKPPSFR